MATEEHTTRERPLYSIFIAVPEQYDLVNRIFTWGLDQRWRRQTARLCLESNPDKVLDLGCGTGDLALWLARFADPATGVFGLDYSLPMLAKAKEKARLYLLQTAVTFVAGDIADLPFANGFFDVIGISFAFRNLTYKNPLTPRYLSEVMRVLKPGGRFVIVESSQPPNRLIRLKYHLYLRWFVRRIGYLMTKNRPAYDYLAESTRKFYTAAELTSLLTQAGFGKVSVKRLLCGICAIHTAVK